MPNDALTRMEKSAIFSLLLKNEQNDHHLSTKVRAIVEEVAPLLQRIPENMPEYTLHDSTHSAKIVEIMGKIIPKEVLTNLNIIELSLLILSAYLHDVGMTCDKTERERIIETDSEFEILFKSNVDKYQKFKQYKLEGNNRAATFIQDQIFTEYLRRNHVSRSAIYIQQKLSNGEFILSYNGIPFYKLLIKICDSHAEPVKNLYDIKTWPKETLVADYIINVQYISLILRLADILDLDAERTPKVIYEFVNPEDPISILEWKKHRSLIGAKIDNRKILFEAECSSPEVERALRQFLDWIEIERKETIELLKAYRPEEKAKYYLELEEIVSNDRIHSDGSYIYNDLVFSLDYHRIMDLLMGQKLYKDPTTALRELLQNAFDAVKVRQEIFKNKLEKITPFIKISYEETTLTIEDNGVGMDESVFKNFFLQIGKSYYSSPIFYSKFSSIDITSEFGIGVLSAFMIATSLTIESRKESDNSLSPYLPIYFEIPTAHSYLIQKESNRKEIGTKLILKLKDNNPFKNRKLVDLLKEIIPIPNYPILISDMGNVYKYKGRENIVIPELEYKKDNEKEFFTANSVYDLDWADSFTHTLFTINFEDEDDYLKDIKGELIIVNANAINYYSKIHGHVSQRDFSVGTPESIEEKFRINITDAIKNLFPKWVSFYSTINLTNKTCLTITPDRSDFVIDEKYKALKEKIERKVILSFKNHLDQFEKINGSEQLNKYINFLYTTGFFGMDLRENYVLSDPTLEFFYQYIKFPILEIDGAIKWVPTLDLIKCENIGVIDKNWSRESIPEILDFKKSNDIQIILLREFYFYSHRYDSLITALLGSKEKLLKPIKLMLRPLYQSPIEIIKYKNRVISKTDDYDYLDFISNSYNIHEDENVVFTIRSTQIYPQLNINHPILSFLSNNIQRNSIEGKIIKQLNINLSNALESSIEKSKQSSDLENVRFLYENGASYSALKGILKRDPELFKELDAIFSELWLQLQNSEIVPASGTKPIFSYKDLPWYWSE